jgi:hypothetical protein
VEMIRWEVGFMIFSVELMGVKDIYINIYVILGEKISWKL